MQMLMNVIYKYLVVVKTVQINIVLMVNTPAGVLMVMNLKQMKRTAKV